LERNEAIAGLQSQLVNVQLDQRINGNQTEHDLRIDLEMARDGRKLAQDKLAELEQTIHEQQATRDAGRVYERRVYRGRIAEAQAERDAASRERDAEATNSFLSRDCLDYIGAEDRPLSYRRLGAIMRRIGGWKLDKNVPADPGSPSIDRQRGYTGLVTAEAYEEDC
jgi:hypothetical protein